MNNLFVNLRRALFFSLPLIAVLLFIAGCAPITPEAPAADSAAVAIPNVAFEVVNGKIVLPAAIPSGIVHFTFVGTNPDTETVDIGRIVAGTTTDALKSALAGAGDNPGPALELVRIYGYSGETNEVTYDLQPGDYMAALNAGNSDATETDLVTFTLGADSGAAAPVADVSVELSDFAFVMPDKISAGPHLWQISNTGKQWHMMLLAHLREGETVEDILSFLGNPDDAQGPPPDITGGFTPMSQGNRAWVTLDLPAGNYVVLCPLPDLMGDMSPHAMKGMVRELTVE